MSKFLLILSTFFFVSVVYAQDTLNYQLVDAFRIDKKYSTEILNYLIKKGELTKAEIDERRLNIFNYVYVIDVVNPNNLNEDGIYRFGILASHGNVYLLIKANNQIEIVSDLTNDEVAKRTNNFLKTNYEQLGEELSHKYRNAVENWMDNKAY